MCLLCFSEAKVSCWGLITVPRTPPFMPLYPVLTDRLH